jgi:signal transduction histidine kinase
MTRRIVGAILLITMFSVVAFALPFAYAADRLYHDEAVNRLERAATVASRGVSSLSLSEGDPIDIPPDSDGVRLAVYDPMGQLLKGDGPARADSPVTGVASGEVSDGQVGDGQVGDELVVAVPVRADDRSVAIVRAAVPMDVVSDKVERAWLAMAALGGGVLVVAGALAVFEGRRLGRPFRLLIAATTKLGQGDFTVTVERSGVAEIDDAGAAVEATAQRLGTMLARERAFSSDASHQLRTPVTGLRLRLETALAGTGAIDATTLGEALADVERLESTIDDLLMLARDTGRSDQRATVAPVLAEIERTWHRPLAAQGRSLRVVVDPVLRPVDMSEAALRQVLDVLVSNASAHGEGTVSIRARPVPGGAAIDVDDEGTIPAGDPERLFRRRSPDARGSGIGLALARSLAEAEGARLVARPAAQRTRFSLFATSE